MMLLIAVLFGSAVAGVCPSASWVVQSSWNAGSVVSITLAPPTSTTCVMSRWSISFAVPSGITLVNLWSSTLDPSSTSSRWNISGPAWQLSLTQSHNFGFQVSGTTPFTAPSVFTVDSGCGVATCTFSGAAATTTTTTLRATTTTTTRPSATTTTRPATTTTTTTRPATTTTTTTRPSTTTSRPSTTSSSSSSSTTSPSSVPSATFDTAVGTSFARYKEFIDKITAPQGSGGLYRSVLWNGNGGGVVSEGQGYGLLMSGILLASMSPTDTNYAWVTSRAAELYFGWKRMCAQTSGSAACQSGGMYCGGGTMLCLPHWQFDDTLTTVRGTGSATDGDEDAILGLILISSATKASSTQYSWWTELTDHAYQSCRAFYDFETTQGLPKLGSCWGGWMCTNPSYMAPAAYRACRDFMLRQSPQQQGPAYVAGWNTVIANSLAVMQGAQCPATGLVPNWYIPVSSTQPSLPGTSSSACAGSGTPPAEFGAEASRSMWRIAADYLIYGTAESATFSRRAALHTASKSTSLFSQWSPLDTGCVVTSVFSQWWRNGFIFGPLFTSLTVPSTGAANQTQVLNNAAQLIASTSISQYYAGAWLTIATMTINGDLQKAGALLRAMV